MYQEQGVLPRDLDRIPTENINPIKWTVGFLNKIFVIAELEVRKLKHDPTELLAEGSTAGIVDACIRQCIYTCKGNPNRQYDLIWILWLPVFFAKCFICSDILRYFNNMGKRPGDSS